MVWLSLSFWWDNLLDSSFFPFVQRWSVQSIFSDLISHIDSHISRGAPTGSLAHQGQWQSLLEQRHLEQFYYCMLPWYCQPYMQNFSAFLLIFTFGKAVQVTEMKMCKMVIRLRLHLLPQTYVTISLLFLRLSHCCCLYCLHKRDDELCPSSLSPSFSPFHCAGQETTQSHNHVFF